MGDEGNYILGSREDDEWSKERRIVKRANKDARMWSLRLKTRQIRS